MKESSQCCCDEGLEEKLKHVERIVDDFVKEDVNLIQILHTVQNVHGALPLDVQRTISQKTGIALSEISGVISFYSFFSTKPKGKHIIKVCMGTACYVRGGKKIVDRLQELLDVEIGETTGDGLFTLEVVRCMGACGLAPAVSIDEKVFKQVNPDKLHTLLSKYYPKEGEQ